MAKRQEHEGFEEFTEQSGTPQRRCQATAKRTGNQCGGLAMRGQKVCRKHGGNAPQNRAKAKERLVEQQARALVETYGRKIETTATEALLDEVKYTAGHVAWLRERVREIDADAEAGTENALVWGVTRKKSGGDDHGVTEEAVPNAWLKLYQAERAHLVKVCESTLRAGVEERMVRMAESQGAKVAEALRGIFGELNLTADQQALVAQVVPRHLRALASG